MPDPKVVGSVLPDLEAAGSVLPDPLGAGYVSPDPLGTGSVSPDPKDMGSISSRVAGSVSPDPRTRVSSRLTGTHTIANHSRSKRMGLSQNSDASEEAGMPRCNPWP